jgi:putative effector of murein hydrolase LrgA (UPF0299 family)
MTLVLFFISTIANIAFVGYVIDKLIQIDKDLDALQLQR